MATKRLSPFATVSRDGRVSMFFLLFYIYICLASFRGRTRADACTCRDRIEGARNTYATAVLYRAALRLLIIKISIYVIRDIAPPPSLSLTFPAYFNNLRWNIVHGLNVLIQDFIALPKHVTVISKQHIQRN